MYNKKSYSQTLIEIIIQKLVKNHYAEQPDKKMLILQKMKTHMKKIIAIIAAALFVMPLASAQNALNAKAENILGDYECFETGNESRMHITANADGSYDGTLFWLKYGTDPATGKPWTDIKNPDKSLRDRPVASLTIITGLKYNAEKKVWEKGKIYDPNRGIKVSCTAQFAPDGSLIIRGSVLGIGESITWVKMQ